MFFGGGNIAGRLAEILLSLPAVLWAITFHEFCHGYAAMKLGDPTAERDGRLSLNPLHHLDPVGALCLLLFRFGWAKPVPINPGYFKKPRRDMVIVSLAGALFVGFAAKILPSRYKIAAAAAEPIGTGIVGAWVSSLAVAPMIGREVGFAFLSSSFLISSVPGSCIGAALIYCLKKREVLGKQIGAML